MAEKCVTKIAKKEESGEFTQYPIGAEGDHVTVVSELDGTEKTLTLQEWAALMENYAAEWEPIK